MSGWTRHGVTPKPCWQRWRSRANQLDRVSCSDQGTGHRPRTAGKRSTTIGSIFAVKLTVDCHSKETCYYYVMRSSPDGVDIKISGHYSDPSLLVLTSLANGPKHGYAMLNDIQTMCGTRLRPGTLYGAIGRLEKQGWIESLPVEERRQPYRLTEAGRSAFSAAMATLQRFAAIGGRRLLAL